MFKLSRKNKKAFTLVELLIVVAIIAILTTLVMFGYASAQKKARDNKRKSDLQAIGAAYLMHYQETKRWYFQNDNELSKITGTPDRSYATREGSSGGGWFNYQLAVPAVSEPAKYVVSMANALNSLGYLSSMPKDPLITSDTDLGSSTGPRQYMKYICRWASGGVLDPTAHGIVLLAKLEDSNSVTTPYSVDKNPNLDKCVWGIAPYNQTLLDYLNSQYKMNYAIEVK